MDLEKSKNSRKDEISCVQLTKETKEKLDKLGTKKDTYESIILRYIESPCVNQIGENMEES